MEKFWRCLIKVSQDFKYASSSKYARTRNMTRLEICGGYTGHWICLNKSEYALIMGNMVTYACMYLDKQRSEYARILNVSDAVLSVKHSTNYWAVIETETYSEHCQTFKMERIMPECRRAARKGRRGLWNYSTLINISPKTRGKI